MSKKIKWGILGLGNIANLFASDLQLSNNAVLHAVASRNAEKAKDFSKKYHASQYYTSYEALAEDPEIDIIYVATPHSFHFEHTMMCLKKGKGVLCEKPLGLNSKEVELMIREARSRNLFLMEGMWTRFIPATNKLVEILENNIIGEVLFMRADFGFKAEANPEGRLFNKKLGGGSLMDLGIYPLYLSLLALGNPSKVNSVARMTVTNVDGHCSMLFDYESEAKAFLESTIEAETPTEAYFHGSKGSVKLHSRFHHSEKISILRDGKEEILDLKFNGHGYIYEIEEVNRCLLNGETESRKLPLQMSLDISRLIDQVKEEIGLKYETSEESNGV